MNIFVKDDKKEYMYHKIRIDKICIIKFFKSYSIFNMIKKRANNVSDDNHISSRHST